jgi:hypothetical protein
MRLLHAALLAGLIVIAIVFFVVLGLSGPVLAASRSAPAVAYGFTAAGLAGLIVSSLVLRPRLLPPGSGRPPAEYWSEPAARTAALLLWVITEGAGALAWIGHLLTGNPIPAAMAILATASLWLQSPDRLAGGS